LELCLGGDGYISVSDNPYGAVTQSPRMACWSATEREPWLDAVIDDPLLPGRILPSDYLEQHAMAAVRKDRRQVEVLRDAGRQLRTFKPE
jgi:hypothetical protein